MLTIALRARGDRLTYAVDPHAALGPRRRGTLEERFFRYVAPMMDDRGCWEWMGCLNSLGYGSIVRTKPPRRALLAHRVSWEVHNGPIPDGLVVCHRCDNPGCVNPAHLFLGTMRDNTADMIAKNRHYNPCREGCLNGHPWSPETIVMRSGRRRCKICEAIRSVRCDDRRRGGPPTIRRRSSIRDLAVANGYVWTPC